MSGVEGDRSRGRELFDGPGLVGARWWREDLAGVADPATRRTVLKLIALLGGAVAIGGVAVAVVSALDDGGGDADVPATGMDSQRAGGWDVGGSSTKLEFAGAVETDADGSWAWRGSLQSLEQDLAPAQESLLPYQVPTLFQLLAEPSAERLRNALRPVSTASTDAAFGRGRALASLFQGLPADTAVLLDLPGAEAVAAAAGMAELFEPVFTFDNWPHPLGVVPSHLTLASAVYWVPVFKSARATRARPAAPVFVLDRNRLAPYVDDGKRFDNRYVAKLPTAEGWNKLAIRHLLYVTPGPPEPQELDDLNDDFVALPAAGIDVKAVALTDFGQSSDPVPEAAAETRSATEPSPSTRASRPAARYWYGGHPHSHFWFWNSYGWHSPARTRTSVAPTGISQAAGWRPYPRPTIFSTPGGGAPRVSRSRTPSPGRSGSFGRSGSSGG